MTIAIDGPLTTPAGLDIVGGLWKELHAHHLQVASYRKLVGDPELSWARRRAWYEQMLTGGGTYFIAHHGTRPVGYTFAQVTPGADDTFETANGIAEIISLVVTAGIRGRGIGTGLVRAVEAMAQDHGINTVKVAVMAGNDRALAFYQADGFAVGETVLYRTLPASLRDRL